MPIEACRLLRRMRGGAQAHLIEADDGHSYVVKFLNNPQHRRILVNEWIAGAVFGYLNLARPETRVVNLSPAFLDANPEVCLQLGSSRQAVPPGWHFGSRFPGDPLRQAIYDFIPDSLLPRIANLSDFLGALVVDKWCANVDARQAIFFRARIHDWVLRTMERPLKVGFVAQLIDHGYLFNGPHWDFPDSPLQGLYFRHEVYSAARSIGDFQPWLDLVRHFPEDVLDVAYRGIPEAWLPGEERTRLEDLLGVLLRRRERVADLIDSCAAARVRPFPNWTGSQRPASAR